MHNRLLRNLICLLLLLGLACGITGLYAQKEAMTAQSRPNWAIIEGH